MEDSENKSSRSPTGRVREGSANRAKNRTVILDSNAAGGVRSRLGSEFQFAGDSGRLGGLEPATAVDDPNWESPRVSSDVGVRKAPSTVVGERAAEAAGAVDAASVALLEPERAAVSDTEPVEQRFEEASGEEAAVAQEEEAASWDPLGLFSGAAEEERLAPQDPRPAPFTPDPLPEFIQAVEEPMLTQADPRTEEVYWKSCTPLVGFLVSFDYEATGSYLELRTGRLIVSAQPDAASNCLVLSHESVSPSHAVMRVAAGGSIQVLDQLSESGTRIRKFDTGEELLLSGDKAVLSHGDVVSFGERNFHVCLVMGNSSQG